MICNSGPRLRIDGSIAPDLAELAWDEQQIDEALDDETLTTAERHSLEQARRRLNQLGP